MTDPPRNDLHFGFVVGITNYPGISDLHGPGQDAAAFHAWLIDPAGGALPPGNVHVVSASSGETRTRAARPTRSDIVAELFDLNDKIRAAVGEDPEKFERSRLYVFLAGHGIAPGGGGAALLPANARRGLYGENLEIDKCRTWYVECGVVRELVVFCDFCRNRIGLAEAGPLGFTRCLSSRGQVETFIGFAAAYDRPAYEEHEEDIPPDERRGFFSRSLVEALTGAGAHGGPVTSDTVAAYVKQRVRELTDGLTPAQEARFPNDLSRPIAFGTGGRTVVPPRQVTIELPPSVTEPLQLLDHRHHPIGRWNPGQGPWTVHLEDGLYAVRPGPGAGRTAELAGGGLFKVVGDDRHVRL